MEWGWGSSWFQIKGGSTRYAMHCPQAPDQGLLFFSQSCCWAQLFFWRSRLRRLRHRRTRLSARIS